MNVELFIARRLRMRRESARRTSPAIAIAVAGVALAVIVMIVSVAVVVGFKREIRAKVMGFDSQITVRAYAPDGTSVTADPTAITLQLPAGARRSLVTRQPAILKTGSDFLGIIIKAIDADGDFSFVAGNITDGSLPDYHRDENANAIIISRQMSKKLRLGVGDKVHAYFFVGQKVRARAMTIAAIYDSNFGDYDSTVAFGPLSLPQGLLGLDPDKAESIEITGLTEKDIRPLTSAIADNAAQAYYSGLTPAWHTVDNVYNSGALYFNWLALLDTNVIVILTLMACVAAFTLVSSLFIIILERVPTIGLLKALGATDTMIRRIFIYMAERLVIKGLVIGNAIALTLLAVQHTARILPLDPEAYYLSYVPVEMAWLPFAAINAGALVVATCVLILPSAIIARISPAKTMRYE